MPSLDPEAQHLSPRDFDLDPDLNDDGPTAVPSRSPYHLPRSEQLRGVANRILFSRYYILFYGAMMGLSLATLVLSLIATHKGDCPPIAWHIIEVILNGLMVLEVTTRWFANGKKFPITFLNIVDLALLAFCLFTLLLVFFSPCSSSTRSEEIFDTILLVGRNAIQFLRLGAILRRSGHSWMNPPKAIDLSRAREVDFDWEDEEDTERRVNEGGLGGRSLVGSGGGRGGYGRVSQEERRVGTGVQNNVGREGLSADDEELWDRL
ncbi:hypothetical protein L202_06667 [Cryptococcus amylolentus CBS 6039]|uniref:Ion transport domain-containing protein n=1 Tax=Cryptococcus amylolentus CBS 6039 TaxID=1295533 RepID=A0A1E3HJF5_9TREE|nr:hypothetical protein L202_06667 [Cryptococcus amylolentus CBS 6039]ODN75541.1 hypothetical protein L202_06667 [Cryptococcus amylolentus CBS 6039]